VLTRYPDDPEALLWLANALMEGDEMEAARAVAEQALVSDPELAMAHWTLSQTYLYSSADGQEAEIDRCLALSPNAASCLRCREILYDQEGRCAEFEETARKIVAIEPRGPLAYVFLADALAARAAPIESVRAVLDKGIAVDVEETPGEAPRDRAFVDVALALLVGDFPAAIAAARARDRAAAGDTSEAGHVGAAMTVITSLEEEGRTSDALAAAEDFERRAPAWTPNDATVRHYLLYARRHAGKLGDAEFARDFGRLETESLVGQSERMKLETELRLRTAYLQPADLPSALPYLDRPSFGPHGELRRGRALLLAGRAAEAVAPLRAAAASCDILPTENEQLEWFGYQAFAFMHSHLWLGQALEATGDTAGACAAYRVVTERWKNAKPRSVTLETARTHSRALHCP
jgi:tetratricopeptide (TPR) repeat protein